MKRKNLIGLIVIIAIVVMAMLAGCVEDERQELSKSAIVGTWEEVEVEKKYFGGYVIEFYKDGTFTMDHMGGHYKFLDDNRLEMDFGGIGIQICEVDFSKNQLAIREHGSRYRYFVKAQ